LDEIDARFCGSSELRRVQIESLRWMVESAIRAGAERIVLNGSFVTDRMEPNDVDCVVLVGLGYPADPTAEQELDDGLPFLDIALVGQVDFDRFVERIFAADRRGVPKGMIEVIL
jgi:hypothetical protein